MFMFAVRMFISLRYGRDTGDNDIYLNILENAHIQILLNTNFYSSIYPGGIQLAQVAKSALFFAC